jgi:hypothetical protein
VAEDAAGGAVQKPGEVADADVLSEERQADDELATREVQELDRKLLNVDLADL